MTTTPVRPLESMLLTALNGFTPLPATPAARSTPAGVDAAVAVVVDRLRQRDPHLDVLAHLQALGHVIGHTSDPATLTAVLDATHHLGGPRPALQALAKLRTALISNPHLGPGVLCTLIEDCGPDAIVRVPRTAFVNADI